jgi:hypothetical protein
VILGGQNSSRLDQTLSGVFLRPASVEDDHVTALCSRSVAIPAARRSNGTNTATVSRSGARPQKSRNAIGSIPPASEPASITTAARDGGDVRLSSRDDHVETGRHEVDRRLAVGPVSSRRGPDRSGAHRRSRHSLGGSAALEWCQSDPRCKAAVNLDGAIWTEVGETGLTKPAMVIAAEHPEMLALPEDLVAAGAFPTVEWCVRERQLPVRRLAASRRRRRIAVDDRGRLPRQLLRHPIRGDAGRFSMAESPWVRPTGRDVATDE